VNATQPASSDDQISCTPKQSMQPFPIDRRSEDRPEAAPRRTRVNLRELCDEVIASHRVAAEADPLTPEDRAAAQVLLAQIAPPLHG
jgi:hypothetical protein